MIDRSTGGTGVTEEDAQALYDMLINSLRADRRGDEEQPFIEVVEEEIREGRRVRRRLSTEPANDGELDTDTAPRRGGGHAEFIGRDDYSPKEKLRILTEALSLARAAPALVAFHLEKTLRSADPNDQGRELLFGNDSLPEPTRTLTADKIEAAVRAVAPLQDAVQTILKELRRLSAEEPG